MSQEMVETDEGETAPTQTEEEKPKHFPWLILLVCIVAAVVVIVVVVVLVVVLTKKDDDDKETSTASSDEPAYSSTAAVADSTDTDEETFATATELTEGNYASTSETTQYEVSGSEAVVKVTTASTFTSTSADEAIFTVSDGGQLLLHANILIQKTVSDSSASRTSSSSALMLRANADTTSGSKSAFIVTGSASYASLYGVTFITKAAYANSIAVLESAKVNVNNCTMYSTMSYSRGIYSPAASSVTVTTATITTKGDYSPLVETAGTIALTSVTGSAQASHFAVLIDSATLTTTSCTMVCYGNDETSSLASGLLMYASSSSSSEQVSFTAKDTTFEISSSSSVYTSAPFIYVKDLTTNIILNNCTATYYATNFFIRAINSVVNCYFTSLTRSTLINGADSSSTINNDDDASTNLITSSDDSTINLSECRGNVFIYEAGSYTLYGSLKYSVIVNTEEATTIILKGATIASSTTAAIAQIGTGALTITVYEGTVNNLSDGPQGATSASTYDACIYSNGALTIDGTGTLNVVGQQTDGEGIATEDQPLTISGNPIISITSADDGLNGGGDTGGTITISGGVITVAASGDGIDSNKDIQFTGGTIFSASSGSSDQPIDSDDGYTFNGATVVAIGTGGMTETAKSANQYSFEFKLSSSISSGTVVTLASDSAVIVSFTATIAFQYLIISSPSLAASTNYYLYTGGSVSGGTTTGKITSGGTISDGTKVSIGSDSTFTFTSGTYAKTYRSSSSSGGGSSGGDSSDSSSSATSGTVSVAITNGTSTSTSISYTASYIITSSATYSSGTYSSTTTDQVVFLVTAGTLTLSTGVTVTKSGDGNSNSALSNAGTTSAADAYSFYGTNSAIVVAGASAVAVLNGVTITTTSTFSNAVVATSQGTITVKSCTITTTGSSNSRGLHATYGGTITASSTTIETSGGSCASLATDRGGGSVTASGMTLTTGGAGSPLIYSTGTITVSDSTGEATYGQIAVVEGKNTVTVTNCSFTAVGTGNREVSGSKVDSCAVMIYQSMSGDSDNGISAFVASDSNFTLTGSYPFIFATNTNGTVTMSNCTCDYQSGQYFITATESDWGTSGSNGANVTYTLTDVTSTTTTAYKKGSSSLTAGSGNGVTLTVTTASSASHANTENEKKSAEEEDDADEKRKYPIIQLPLAA